EARLRQRAVGAGARDVAEHRDQPVVQVTRVRHAERQLSLDPDELARPRRSRVALRERLLEGGDPNVAVAAGNARQRAERDCRDDEHVAGDDRRSRDGANAEHDDEEDRDADERGDDAPPLGDHACTGTAAAPRSSSRTLTSAASASSLISGPGSCWLNFAHSKSDVSRDAAPALVSRLASARETYSNGASAGCRSSPTEANARSIRA